MISADDNGLKGRDYDWIYVQMGRVKEIKWDGLDYISIYHYTLQNQYNANSQRTQRTLHVDAPPYGPFDAVTEYWWRDRLGRVTTQQQWDSAYVNRMATYHYFADGQLDTMQRFKYDHPNWTNVVTTKWTYDGAGRLDTLEHRNPSNVLIAGYDYAWDAANRMSTMDFLASGRDNEDVTFSHDDAFLIERPAAGGRHN